MICQSLISAQGIQSFTCNRPNMKHGKNLEATNIVKECESDQDSKTTNKKLKTCAPFFGVLIEINKALIFIFQYINPRMAKQKKISG